MPGILSMKKIAVFTSGGDSPGMNACLRAVVRTALKNNIEVAGIRYGYEGMIDNDFVPLDATAVGNIIHRGGTILKTARSKRFHLPEGMEKAAANLALHGIEGVVAIGGDGTFKGANEFKTYSNIPFIGCPGTIDNDLVGTDYTIGFDTALNTVIEAVDRIRDTAESHNRLFIVEVMGRDAGLIALYSGIGSGAEGILIPESGNDMENLLQKLENSRREKMSRIVLVAEGDEGGGALRLSERLKSTFPELDVRVTILGHIQRGGAPSCMERLNASRMGMAAVEALLAGRSNEMIGIVDHRIFYTPFANAVKYLQQPDNEMLRIIDTLS